MKKILVVLMAMMTMAVMLTGCGGDSKKAAYPADGDISVIIPKAPGGGTDISARGLIQFMEKELKGSKFVPVNKPDGGGVTGGAGADDEAFNGVHGVGMRLNVRCGVFRVKWWRQASGLPCRYRMSMTSTSGCSAWL